MIRQLIIGVSCAIAAFFLQGFGRQPEAVGCARFDAIPVEKILDGGDPFALECLLEPGGETDDGRLRAIDESKVEIARINLDLERNRNQDAITGATAWLDEHSASEDQRNRTHMSLMLVRAYKRAGQYLKARDVLDRALSEISGPATPSFTKFWQAERALLGLPPPAANGEDGARLDVSRNPRGKIMIEAVMNGSTVPMMIDTGAPVALIGEEKAKRLGFTFIPDSAVDIKMIFGPAASGVLAVAPPISLGGMTIRNLPFIVVPEDAQAHDAIDRIIIGSPTLMFILGRFALLDEGRFVALGEAAPDPACLDGAGRAFRTRDGVGLGIDLPSGPAPAFLDTGWSPKAMGYRRQLQFYAPDIRLHREPIGFMGDGSDASPPYASPVWRARSFRFSMDHADIRVSTLHVMNSRDDSILGDALVIGGPVARDLAVLTIDFRTMTYAARNEIGKEYDHCLPG